MDGTTGKPALCSSGDQIAPACRRPRVSLTGCGCKPQRIVLRPPVPRADGSPSLENTSVRQRHFAGGPLPTWRGAFHTALSAPLSALTELPPPPLLNVVLATAAGEGSPKLESSREEPD